MVFPREAFAWQHPAGAFVEGAPQFGDERRAGGIAVIGILGEGFAQHRVHPDAEGSVEFRGRGRIGAADLVEQNGQRIAGKRLLFSEDVEHHHGESELIGAAIHRLALDLFRRHVAGCTHQHAGGGHLLGDDFGHSEIAHFGSHALVDHDVGGLDVTVDDAVFVGVIKGRGGLGEQVHHQGSGGWRHGA